MTAYEPAAWETFFAANAGAAAALAGLVFVGVSINVDEIVASRRLTGRALEAFAQLSLVLVVSALGLVPAITLTGLGVALLVVGSVFELIVTWQHVHSIPHGAEAGVAPAGSSFFRILLGQSATVPVIVAGITLLVGDGGGLYWLVPAIVLAYAAALTNAWVLVIEIRR
jgi:modulator of FtsH protease